MNPSEISDSSTAASAEDVPGSPEQSRRRPKPGERRLQILQAIAAMLEEGPADRVTTAALARRLEVSEAALYRHFASKAQMFEGLLDFIEQTIFGLINQIEASQDAPQAKARAIMLMLLTFAEKNPGMSRVLAGDAISLEHDRLQTRVNQLIGRVEASLRQCLKLVQADQGPQAGPDPAALASLAMGFVQGRWLRFTKTRFQELPTQSAGQIAAMLFGA